MNLTWLRDHLPITSSTSNAITTVSHIWLHEQRSVPVMTKPTLAIINQSTILTDAQVSAAVPAFQWQVTHDFAPVWGRDATLVFVPKGQSPPSGSWWVVLLDDSDVAGALGYHDLTSQGLPLAKIFAKTDRQFGLSWTITITHEILEMLGDPYINQTAIVGSSGSTARLYAYEACDACEADQFGYLIGWNTTVSDFVLPTWFVPGESGPFDKQGHIKKPLALLSGGYIGYMDVNTQSGWQQLTAQTGPRPESAGERGHRFERRRRGFDRWRISTAHPA